MLYEVAIIEKWIDGNDEEKERILLLPTAILAKDNQSAVVGTILKNKDAVGDVDINDLVVLVRPFV